MPDGSRAFNFPLPLRAIAMASLDMAPEPMALAA